jgi:peptidoglycan hydrolase CwlO-like protein
MLAVHEEKLSKQEEAIVDAEQKIEVRRAELSKQIDELHSRITTNTKELMNLGTAQHEKHSKEIKKLSDDINKRVGVLEKWRHIIIGGAIIIGFILNKFISFSP